MDESRTSWLEAEVQEATSREEAKWLRRTGDSEAASQGVLTDLARGAGRLGKQMRSAAQGDKSYTVSISRSDAARAQLAGPRSAAHRGMPIARPTYAAPTAQNVVGGLLLVAAAGAALFALFGRRLGWRWRWGRAPQKGRYIRDRALGGKLIFIPDTADSPPSPASVLLSWDADKGPRVDGGEAAADQLLQRSLNRDVAAPAPAGPPEWWQPPAEVVPGTLSASTSEEALREAKGLLKALQDEKILAGRDYDLYKLTQLRSICQRTGVTARPATDNVRDAMFRSGVGAAVAAAYEGRAAGMLGGSTAREFVCGLARDLEVGDAAAVRIVHAAMASKSRSAIIDAVAASIAENEDEMLQTLIGLANLLDALPLPPGSAEAEMVGAAASERAGLEHRKKVLVAFSFLCRPRAGVVAEMVGFDPALVLPQLDSKVTGAAPQSLPADAPAGEA